MTYTIYYRSHDGYLSQWSTIAANAEEARAKFIKTRGSHLHILYIKKWRTKNV